MNRVRVLAFFAALGVHIAFLAVFLFSSDEPNFNALQSGAGKDDLSIVATITMQTEESLGLDAASLERQDASAGGQPTPPKEEAQKDPEKLELRPEESPEPAPPVEEKPDKKTVETKVQPQNAAPASEAQEQQRAASRAFEARRSQVISLYNGQVYQALMRNALRPKSSMKGRVVLELTLAPSGELMDHRVVQSSGSAALDRTAMTSLERAAPFPPAPPELSKEPHTIRVPFEYAIK